MNFEFRRTFRTVLHHSLFILLLPCSLLDMHLFNCSLSIPYFCRNQTSRMTDYTISLIVSGSALIISLVTFFLWNKSRSKKPTEEKFNTRPLQLQAYERLVVLTERISL